MPQMAPLNWLSMMLMMCSILMIYSSIWYFSFLLYPAPIKKKNEKFKLWKW
nr:ATP synthase F0 subunit 8 [Octodonta nipae]